MAPSPSGKARVCKTLITSSNLVGASNFLLLPTLLLYSIIAKIILVLVNNELEYTRTSNRKIQNEESNLNMPVWRNGRRKGLKILRAEMPVSVRPRPPAPQVQEVEHILLLFLLFNYRFLGSRLAPSSQKIINFCRSLAKNTY